MPLFRGNPFAGMMLCVFMSLGGCAAAYAQTGPGVLAFSPAIVTVSEGAGNVFLSVTRTQGSAGAIAVSYSTFNGTATAPGDYLATSGTLQWDDGDSGAKSFPVAVVQNATPGGTRQFSVFLSNATGGATIALQNGQLGLARVMITDDEADPFPATGSLSGYTYAGTNGGELPWSVETQFGYQSRMSVRSPTTYGYDSFYYDEETGELMPIVLAGEAIMQLQDDFLAGNLSFAYRVSSGLQGRFSFLDNNIERAAATGQSDWQTITIPVATGTRNFKWRFANEAKDVCGAPPAADGLPCTDRVYVDSIVLPPRAARLTVQLPGGFHGTVDVSGQDTCAQRFSCPYYFAPGATVTLTANPAPGYFLSGWSGDCGGVAACTLTMDAARTVSAVFLPTSPTISVSVLGDGQGSVTSTPGGVNCPGDCSESYPNGTTVTLTATPAPGSFFGGWNGYGGCSGTGPCTISLTNDMGFAVSFLDAAPSLTITLAGSGSGTVVSSPPGISCPGTCTADFPRNAYVTLTSTPDAGSHGGQICSGLSSCVIWMTTNHSFVATFQPGVVSSPPLLNAVNPGANSLNLVFDPPADSGGLAITQYIATCGTTAVAGTSSPIIVAGLAAGTPHACNVKAVNAAGTSAASNTMSGTPVPPLSLNAVASRKLHGSAGLFDRYIDHLAAPAGPVTIEPRMIGPGHKLVFMFNMPITSVGFVSSSSGSATLERDDNKVIVTLTGLPDNRRVQVQLTDVAAVGGVMSMQVSVGFLVGDVSRSGVVTAADIAAVRAGSSQILTQGNYLLDIDLSGAIDRGDVSAAKARAGIALP